MSKIDIKLATSADLQALQNANKELVKMINMTERGNESIRQSVMKTARAYYSYGEAIEKVAYKTPLTAKQIEEAWRKAMPQKEIKEGIVETTSSLKTLGDVAKGAAKGLGGTFNELKEMFTQGGIWGAMAAVLSKVVSELWDYFKKKAEQAAKRAERVFKESLDSIKDGASEVEERFDAIGASIDRNISRFDRMAKSINQLTKAEIELAKQMAIANGMDPSAANAAASDLSAQVDYQTEKERLEHIIKMEQKRVDAGKEAEAKTAKYIKEATDKKIAAEAEYQKKRDEYVKKHARDHIIVGTGIHGYMQIVQLSEAEKVAERARAAADFEDSDAAAKLREKIRNTADVLKGIKTDEKALLSADEAKLKIKEAERALLTLETKHEAMELAKDNEISAKKKTVEEKRIADVKAAELKAVTEAAKVREQLDREAHKKRMDDIRAEIAAATGKGNILKATAANAQNEFDRAFAMYRDPSHAASVISEEKDYRNDLNRLHRDASRYGGKWRIDELSRLMAAGDSQGVSDTLASWRKSKSFSPEIEAMVRASAAERTKTTAEEELRKINANTAGLAQKLDELLAMKGN